MSDKPPTASRAVSQEAREAADKIRWGTPFEYSPGTTILIPPTLTESAAIIQTACVAYADRECAALKARVAELKGAQTRLLNVARGCRDYGGGHSGKDYQNFQHGIETVIRSLEAAAKRDPGDTQVNALEAMGRATRQLEVISWQVGTPVIGAGEMARYWCAVKGSAAEGRRLLCYGNAYIMPLSDSCHDAPANAVAVGDDGDYAWTGWFETSCEQCDTYWAFHGEVIRWFELPEATRQLEGKP